MGIAIPQVVTSDRASGAQTIDGSVGINSFRNYHFERDPGSAGNRKTFTFSGWVKKYQATTGEDQAIIEARTSSPSADGDIFGCRFEDDARISVYDYGNFYVRSGVGRMRDTNGWYHIFFSVDTTVASNNVKLYVNNVLVGQGSHAQNTDTRFNSTDTHRIGARDDGSENYWLNAAVTNFYVIDGQALEPTDFGFTDPLTNTWKPKKYEGTFGTNGFYLPMDGNSPIGEDKSGNGNDFTPVNFGGSVALDSPAVSGARPILNTTQGGTQAGVGVFGSKENKYYTVTTANGSVYQFDITSGDNPSLSFIRGATYKFDYSDHTSHPVLFSSTNPDSSTTAYTDGTDIASNVISFTVPHNAPDTLYYYCQNHPTSMNGSISITTDETKADPYAWKCVLACPLTGNNIDVSNEINCTSTTKAMTNVGNAAASSDTSNFYKGSFEFDGSGDGITTPDNTDFEFGSGDFTVECWVKQDDTSGFDVFVGKYGGSGENGGEFIVGKNGNTPTFYWQDSSGNANINATNFTGNTNSWYHMACVREGNDFIMYINGICENFATDSTTLNATSNKLTIAFENNESSSAFDGYLQDVRIYKGVAKYFANGNPTVGTQYFIPPSTSPDILPDTPSGVSGSSKLTKITDGAVSFDGTGDYLNVPWSSDFELGTGDFTIEYYGYWNTSGTSIAWGQTIDERFDLGSLSAGSVRFFCRSSASTFINISADIVPSKWSHIAAVREGTAFRLYIDGKLGASGTASNTMPNDSSRGVDIGRRRYSTSDSTYTNGSISNLRVIKGTALYTSDFTPPTAPLTNVTNTKLLCCQSNTQAGTATTSPSMGGVNDGTVWSSSLTSSSGFRSSEPKENAFDGDTSSICSAVNDGTITFTSPVTFASDSTIRVVVHGGDHTVTVNGGADQTISAGSLQTVTYSNSGNATFIMTFKRDAIADTGVRAIEINGVILTDPLKRFGDAAATNFNPFNTDINTVRGQESGYATLDPLAPDNGAILSDGNLETTFTTDSSTGTVPGTIFVDSGKWYCEVIVEDISASAEAQFGIIREDDRTNRYIGATGTNGYGWEPYQDRRYGPNAANTKPFFGTTYTSGTHHFEMALDLDEGTLDIYNDGVLLGELQSGIPSGRYTFAVADIGGADVPTMKVNFGQKPFKFPPPDGFQPLNTANTRPETVISRPDQYVGVSTYSGDTSSSAIDVTGYNFKPDLIWVKKRTGATDTTNRSHIWTDSVRGAGVHLRSDDTDPQEDLAKDLVTSFNRDGFTAGYQFASNYTGSTYVSWSWKAGGQIGVGRSIMIDDVGYATTTAAGLTAGDIPPTGASVGTKQGFSIIKWESILWAGSANRQVPHGLTQAPEFIITKGIENAAGWYCYHKDLDASNPQDYYLTLNTNDERGNLADSWGPNKPDATTFGDRVLGWSDGQDVIAYCWHSVPGLQKFGQYTGNNSSDGPFIELGFRPAVVLVKIYSGTTSNWVILDKGRDPDNVVRNNLYADTTDGDNQFNWADFLSNGFKPRVNLDQINGDGRKYIYAAWAEAPSIDLYGGGANAR